MQDYSDTIKVHLDNITELASKVLFEYNVEVGWQAIAIPKESKKKITAEGKDPLAALASLLAALRDGIHHASEK